MDSPGFFAVPDEFRQRAPRLVVGAIVMSGTRERSSLAGVTPSSSSAPSTSVRVGTRSSGRGPAAVEFLEPGVDALSLADAREVNAATANGCGLEHAWPDAARGRGRREHEVVAVVRPPERSACGRSERSPCRSEKFMRPVLIRRNGVAPTMRSRVARRPPSPASSQAPERWISRCGVPRGTSASRPTTTG